MSESDYKEIIAGDCRQQGLLSADILAFFKNPRMLYLPYALQHYKVDIGGCSYTAPEMRLRGPKNYLLVNDFTVTIAWYRGKTRLVTPRGYGCDGSSVPMRFADVVSPEHTMVGAFTHDPIYESHGGDRLIRVLAADGTTECVSFMDAGTNEPFRCTREEADVIWGAICLAGRVARKEVYAGYTALRTCGDAAWQDEEDLKLAALESASSSMMA